MQDSNTHHEEYTVSGDQLVRKIKDIIKAGNARRIILKDSNKQVLMEIPLTFAVVGTVVAPILAAVGALAALVSECSITVVKKEAVK